VISVRDNGIGIAAEHLSHVFEPFAQVEPALQRPHGGLGIGLSLAQRLVELHGGRIEAHSAGTGKGSEFIVKLPTIEHSAPRINGESQCDDFGGALRCRVLIADDNPDALASLSMMLDRLGCDVQTVASGTEAVEAVEQFHPDVALLDIGMPDINGYETARLIREQPVGGELRLIAMTGWGQEEDKRRAREAGFDQHLTKPVELRALQELLQPIGAELGRPTFA
jgi:CheY-like chemotaxis protein